MQTSRLGQYVVALVNDAKARQAFFDNAAAAAESRSLGKDERGVLENDSLHQLLRFLDAGPRPTTPEKQPLGGGTEGNSSETEPASSGGGG